MTELQSLMVQMHDIYTTRLTSDPTLSKGRFYKEYCLPNSPIPFAKSTMYEYFRLIEHDGAKADDGVIIVDNVSDLDQPAPRQPRVRDRRDSAPSQDELVAEAGGLRFRMRSEQACRLFLFVTENMRGIH